ncbi:PAAR domain-containing protein [Saccharothrix obliqua]|uniref:PAAR domain-containing protein n=1 Tax=Saccharothrix obliqua TaxID=2861747 RepID=UPI001C6060D8|nr:PAAR domain-containing protein [Saccharothrix obliqua]MBW4720273.1 PAAR domain-containing protein [Saccharothrix obliqua]
MAFAARIGDKTSHGGSIAPPPQPALAAKVVTVLIENAPAAVIGCVHACVKPPDPLLGPSNVVLPRPVPPPSVFIGGVPAAVVGDRAVCQATIVLGAKTVLIGGLR